MAHARAAPSALPLALQDFSTETDGTVIASKLSALTDGALDVHYQPGAIDPCDPERVFRYFTAMYTGDDEREFLHLDDSLGDLRAQLINELRRLSRVYSDLADAVCRRIAHAVLPGLKGGAE